MEKIRLQYKEVVSIEVSNDCIDKYSGRTADAKNLIEITKNYLINELRKNNTDYETAVLECMYSPVKHRFVIYTIMPYICDEPANLEQENAPQRIENSDQRLTNVMDLLNNLYK